MKTIDFSKEDCISALRSLHDEIDEIFKLFDDQGRISRDNIPKARKLLANLKDKLKKDYKKRATAQGEADMSAIERAYYFPAIHEAWTSIHVATNSMPSRKWLEELGDAQSTISYYLHQLRRDET